MYVCFEIMQKGLFSFDHFMRSDHVKTLTLPNSGDFFMLSVKNPNKLKDSALKS